MRRDAQDWGIVRYLQSPNAGDAATFDGWYTDHTTAKEIYRVWCERFPNFIVALVRQEQARFPDPHKSSN